MPTFELVEHSIGHPDEWPVVERQRNQPSCHLDTVLTEPGVAEKRMSPRDTEHPDDGRRLLHHVKGLTRSLDFGPPGAVNEALHSHPPVQRLEYKRYLERWGQRLWQH